MELKKKALRAFTILDKSYGPPMWVQAHHGAMRMWGNAATLHTLVLLGVKPEHSILDYGCGAGRMAEQLWINGTTKYTGLDCDELAICYAKRNYGYAGFDFHVVPVSTNSVYLGEWKADRAIAISLFTHLLPGESTAVLRVFEGCEAAVISLFLARDKHDAYFAGARVEIADGLYVMRKDNPNAIVVHQTELFESILKSAGWRIADTVHGSWRQLTPKQCAKQHAPYQDHIRIVRL